MKIFTRIPYNRCDKNRKGNNIKIQIKYRKAIDVAQKSQRPHTRHNTIDTIYIKILY